MAKQDYYEVLGISKQASDADIKKAYKRLAMKHHPDRNKDNKKASETKFKTIQEAYAILSNSQKRGAYDQFGHAGVDGSAGGFGNGAGFDFGDIFSDFFGSGQRQTNNRGNDLQYNLEINLKEAVEGKTVKIRIPRDEKCTSCSGSGAKAGTNINTCSTCGGSGQVQTQQGFFAIQKTCSTCGGKGKTIANPCSSCRGSGVVKVEKHLSVKIPAGVDTGNRIRLQNEGETGVNGGATGDLYVQIHVKEHNIFQRHNDDLYCEAPIAFTIATLGGSIEIPTLNSRAKIKIPQGTQSGKIFRIRGKGSPSVRGGSTGDLLCKIKVETPVNLNSKQKELLQEFANSCGKDASKNHPKSKSFFNSIKTFFDK